jgi:hypothetical protein
MNAPIFFNLTGVSGMIGMLSLIALNLLTYWIDLNVLKNSPSKGSRNFNSFLSET